MKENLVQELEKLVKDFPLDNRDRFGRAIEGPLWSGSDIAHKIIELIKSDKRLEIFDNHHQRFGDSSYMISYNDLLLWLEESTRRIGADKSVDNLFKYTAAKSVSVQYVELIIGTLADSEYTFCNGIKLTSPHNLANLELAATLVNESYYAQTPYPKVTMVLIGYVNHPIIHKRADIDYGMWEKIETPHEQLEDVRLCISLSRHPRHGIHSLARTYSVSADLPFLKKGTSWSLLPFKYPSMQNSILEMELRNADELLNKYQNLEPDFKQHLKIPLHKLNDYGSGEDSVDKAIDLRTCLESIFLGEDDKEQIGFRLALRASLLLGTDFGNRKEIFSLMKKTYSITSRAVHNGKFDKKDKIKDLDKAAQLARKALIHLINNGPVDWEELELRK
ncbi:MAG TPA: hypothetical protein DHW42_04335 [Candidatus Marinimicrobia bacterium]|nr:hypothetical protein [Candidatus Neomarinimicrobiota bacterium]